MLQLTMVWTENFGLERTGGMERSSPASSTRISLIGGPFGGWEEPEEYSLAAA